MLRSLLLVKPATLRSRVAARSLLSPAWPVVPLRCFSAAPVPAAVAAPVLDSEAEAAVAASLRGAGKTGAGAGGGGLTGDVYAELVRSLVVAGSFADATRVMEQMLLQKFPVTTTLCNGLVQGWLGSAKGSDAAVVPAREAARVLRLMQRHGVRRNELSVALGLVAALRVGDGAMVAELGSYAARQEGSAGGFALFRLVRAFAHHGGVAAASARPDLADGDMVRAIVGSARALEGAKEKEQQQPAAVPAAPPLAEEEALEPLYREQLALEVRATTDAVLRCLSWRAVIVLTLSRYREALQEVINLGRGANTGPAQDVLLLW